jgi:HrpA-like RNA helicase
MNEYDIYIKQLEQEKLRELSSMGSIGVLDPYGIYPNPFTNQPFSQTYRDTAIGKDDRKGWNTQLTYEQRFDFFKMLIQNQVVLVIAGTGVGKTVIIPKLVSHYFGYKKKIIITIPTRKAVVSSAGYSAKCLDVELGSYVGYAIGGENKMSEDTHLLYATDGYVRSSIISEGNENLPDYDGIIIDEAHQRSEQIDVLLALVCNIATIRPEFRIIIMSASMDGGPFFDYFKRLGLRNTIYEPHGPPSIYEIKDIYEKKTIEINKVIPDTIVLKIDELLKDPRVNNILGFVTTKASIIKVINQLKQIERGKPHEGKVFYIGIHGGTSEEDRLYALGDKSYKELGDYRSKVIIGTNVVEFSVTFEDGLDYVIDSGLKWEVRFDPKLNCDVMGNVYIAKSNITQRRGRTGRTNPGTCIHLYTKEQFDKFEDYQKPDILNIDCTNIFLQLIALPINGNFQNTYNFMNNMITPPLLISQTIAIKNLVRHNLLGLNGYITPFGSFLTSLGDTNYMIVKSIVAGYYFGVADFMIVLGAVIKIVRSFTDVFKPPFGCDIKLLYRQIPNDFKYKKEQLYFNRNVVEFIHPYGCHLTICRVYLETVKKMYYDRDMEIELEELELNYANEFITSAVQFRMDDLRNKIFRKQKLREQFCNDKCISYDTMKLIDESYEELKNVFVEHIIRIASFDLFEIDNLVHNKLLDDLNKAKNQADIGFRKMIGGGKDKLNYKLLELNDLSKKYLTVLKNDSKVRKTTINKRSKKNKSGSGGGKKAPKKNVSVRIVKEVNEHLEKITLQDLPRLKIIPFNRKQDNIMASFFYGYFTQIAGYLGKEADTFNNKKYIVKYTPGLIGDISDSSLDIILKRPKFIIYSSLTLINNQPKFGLISRVPVSVIKKFIDLDIDPNIDSKD